MERIFKLKNLLPTIKKEHTHVSFIAGQAAYVSCLEEDFTDSLISYHPYKLRLNPNWSQAEILEALTLHFCAINSDTAYDLVYKFPEWAFFRKTISFGDGGLRIISNTELQVYGYSNVAQVTKEELNVNFCTLKMPASLLRFYSQPYGLLDRETNEFKVYYDLKRGDTFRIGEDIFKAVYTDGNSVSAQELNLEVIKTLSYLDLWKKEAKHAKIH